MEDTLSELRAKGVIDKHFKILSADNTITSVSDKTTPLPGHLLRSPFQVSLISSEQPIDFIINDTKDEQINNLNAEVKALKSFIVD